MPITFDLKLVANLNSSVMVVANRFFGDISPASEVLPTVFTVGSSVQYIDFPVACTVQSLPAIPWIDGTEPV